MYPENTGLYNSQYEKDACGVGLIADLENIPTHQTVKNGITILKNLMHRGATGGDPETGDGAGILTSLPDEFFRKAVKEKLPASMVLLLFLAEKILKMILKKF